MAGQSAVDGIDERSMVLAWEKIVAKVDMYCETVRENSQHMRKFTSQFNVVDNAIQAATTEDKKVSVIDTRLMPLWREYCRDATIGTHLSQYVLMLSVSLMIRCNMEFTATTIRRMVLIAFTT
jgi:hypothetical protein